MVNSAQWGFLKNTGFIPSFAKSVAHEPRNGISLCDSHHSDFDGYRFFIRWDPSVSLDGCIECGLSYDQQDRVFVFVNFSRNEFLEQFHGKTVALDPGHSHSPFPAPFLIQEMRTRGFHPWYTDRPIPRPLHPTYPSGDGGVVGVGDGGHSDIGIQASSSSGLVSAGSNQPYLVLSNPFQDPGLLESMRQQWQRLPNWNSATVEGLTWEGTAEENAKRYVDLVGIP